MVRKNVFSMRVFDIFKMFFFFIIPSKHAPKIYQIMLAENIIRNI